jgi:S-adenosylmethionine-diacylgycerolhomoserine-N-methlytransferase
MNQAIQGYYALHSRIYDATRWTFLFGRESILRRSAKIAAPERILEVGCGTGRNLRSLRRIFPKADITGVDLSGDMLSIARRKTTGVKLIQQAYEAPLTGKFDLVLFSYALTMFNPGWENALQAAKADLRPGGLLAIVDFSHTGSSIFRRWMGVNHVRMEGHLWPASRADFEPMVDEIRAAYAGIWYYGMFIGKVRSPQ